MGLTKEQMLYMSINFILDECDKQCDDCPYGMKGEMDYICVFSEIDWRNVGRRN